MTRQPTLPSCACGATAVTPAKCDAFTPGGPLCEPCADHLRADRDALRAQLESMSQEPGSGQSLWEQNAKLRAEVEHRRRSMAQWWEDHKRITDSQRAVVKAAQRCVDQHMEHGKIGGVVLARLNMALKENQDDH